jgi:hypothetical protein
MTKIPLWLRPELRVSRAEHGWTINELEGPHLDDSSTSLPESGKTAWPGPPLTLIFCLDLFPADYG